MENKNAKPGIEDLLFVWNHIHERFRRLQCYRNTEQPKKDLTPDQLEEREQEKGKPVLNLPARGENFHFFCFDFSRSLLIYEDYFWLTRTSITVPAGRMIFTRIATVLQYYSVHFKLGNSPLIDSK